MQPARPMLPIAGALHFGLYLFDEHVARRVTTLGRPVCMHDTVYSVPIINAVVSTAAAAAHGPPASHDHPIREPNDAIGPTILTPAHHTCHSQSCLDCMV